MYTKVTVILGVFMLNEAAGQLTADEQKGFIKFSETYSPPDNTCALMSGKARVSTPSLKTCYRNTRDSCCSSGHDEEIADKLKLLISEPCLEEYDHLIQYYCFACYSQSAKFAVNATKTLKICKSFAERVWAGGEYDLKSLSDGKPRSTYDNCGLKYGPIKDEEEVYIQSLEYPTYVQFFDKIKPPFFENYTIEFVDGITDCYNISHKLGGFMLVLALSIIAMF
jgi:hypothetical protein